MSEENQKFTVIAETENYNKPLYLYNLTFFRLIDDVVNPYQNNQPFFIDGVPVKKESLKKIKILNQSSSFEVLFDVLHSNLRLPKSSGQRVLPEDYPIRLEALFREAGEDVTSQIIQAYDNKIGSNSEDYATNRKELIKAAFQIFIESIKLLG